MSNTGISVGIVAVVGDYGVGKTCLLQRFVTGKYSEDHQCTIGLNYQSKVIDVCGRKVKLHFMDTGGDEKFESINMIHVRRSVCVLLVYDVTREKSIIRIDKWFKNIEQTAPSDVIKILVGCKYDKDVVETSVSTDIGQAVAEHYKTPFFEVSAKNNTNVKELLNTIAEMSLGVIHTRFFAKVRLVLAQELAEIRKPPNGGCSC